MSRLDGADGVRPPGPGPGLRAAGARRAARGGGGRRPGRGDEPAMNDATWSPRSWPSSTAVRRCGGSPGAWGSAAARSSRRSGRSSRPAAVAARAAAARDGARQPARRLRAGDRRPAGAVPRHHGPTGPRGIAPARLHGRLHDPLRAGAAAAPAPGRRAGAAVRDRPGEQAQMDYSTYDLDFTRRRPPPRARLQLRAGLLAAAVPPLRRGAGLRHDRPRAHPRLRAPGRGRGDLPLRQHESRGQRLRRRRAGLQPAVPGVRGPLRLPAGGLPAAAAPDQGEGRAAVLAMSKPACSAAGPSAAWST